jgi:RNA recognition motif-containing protein
MSVTESTADQKPKSRKRNLEAAEIEIDVDAPEPPSKKSLRKAKKSSTSQASEAKSSEQQSASTQSKDPKSDSKRSDYGVWIGNLSFGTTKEDLLNFFTSDSTHTITRNQITRVHLPLGQPKFGKPSNKGFAYVDFIDAGTLKSALEFSEALLDGRRVLIKDARNFEGRPEPKKDEKDSQGKAPSKRVFIGNLDFDTTAEDLEEHFSKCGSILHTHMATFEDSGKCKGFAWIEFEQLTSAEAAMRGWVEARGADQDQSKKQSSGRRRIWLHSLKGRKLRMEFAEDKATRYQKRFGKGSSASESNAEGADAVHQQQEEAIEEVEARPQRVATRKHTKQKPYGTKYADETVQRLTGAIVEGKGQKVVFD